MENRRSQYLAIERKRLKKVVSRLPFDCWGYILDFVDGNNDFLVLLYTIEGLYSYIRFQNSYCTRNRIFNVYDFPPEQKFGHIHKIRVGGEPFRGNSSKEFMKTHKVKLVRNLFDRFPNLSYFYLDCDIFPNISKSLKVTIDILPKASRITLDKLKSIVILHRGDLIVNLFSDFLPNLESIHIGHKASSRNRKNSYNWNYTFGAGGRGFFSAASLYCFGDFTPLPRLRRLTISSRLISMNPHLVSKLSNQLRFLKLKNTSVDGIYNEINSFPLLEELHLERIKILKFRISNLPKLRKLTIKSGECVQNWDIQYHTLENLEEAFIEKVEISEPNTFLVCKNLRKLQLDVYGKKAKLEDDDFFLRSLSERYKTLELGSFRETLEDLTLLSSVTDVVVTDAPGVKNLEILLVDNEIVVKDDLVSMKPSVEKIDITQNWKERFYPNRLITLSFFKGTHSFSRKFLFFSKFAVLKELILTNYLIQEIRVSKCPLLQKIEFRFRSFCPSIVDENSTEKFVIIDCPKLTDLFLDDNVSSYTEIRGCKNITKLRLRDSKRFPLGIDLSRIIELDLTECYPGLLRRKEIKGEIFCSLKRLLICQRFFDKKKSRKIRIDDDDDDEDSNKVITIDVDDDNDEDKQEYKKMIKSVAVERLTNLTKLEFLRIRCRKFNVGERNENGIMKINGVNRNVEIIIEEGFPKSKGVVVSWEEEEVKRKYEFYDEVNIQWSRKMGYEEFMRLFCSCKVFMKVNEKVNEPSSENVYFVRRDSSSNDDDDDDDVVIEDRNDQNNVVPVVINISDSDDDDDVSGEKSGSKDVIVID